MKYLIPLYCLLLLASCKNTPETEAKTEAPELPLLEQLAAAHGYDNWKEVNQIQFTWNIDRDTTHFERTWIWDVRRQEVTRIMAGDTVTYLRAEVDSTLAQVDGGFINDKYWLLAPFQWVWDGQNITHTYQEGVSAPLSGAAADKLTIVYGDSGGYTPGDAYDFYLDADSKVMEWAFRKANQPEPNLITTWEGYQDYGGLQLSTMRQNPESGFKLYFTGIEIR